MIIVCDNFSCIFCMSQYTGFYSKLWLLRERNWLQYQLVMYKLSKVPPLEGLAPPVDEGEKGPSELLLHHNSPAGPPAGLKSSPTRSPPSTQGPLPLVIHSSSPVTTLHSSSQHDRQVTSSSPSGQTVPENLCRDVSGRQRHISGGLVTRDCYNRLLPEILMPPPPAPRN